MTQHERLREFMKEWGPITPFEAFEQLGITKLSTRIGEMIRAGDNIKKEVIYDRNRYGEPVHYCRYSLVEKED